MLRAHHLVVPFTVAALSAAALGQQTINITVTNNQPAGGMTTSPWWVAVHNGTFDIFNPNVPASPALETLAELGNGTSLTEALGAAGVAGVVATEPAQPQFTPGESASMNLIVTNPTQFRWFIFASMLVPSNDYFTANDNPLQFPIFNAAGQFTGPVTIQIFGSSFWEAQTEVDDINIGPAFLVGRDIVAGIVETGGVIPLFSTDQNITYLAMLVGQQTPAYTLTDGLTGAELVATITITPAPSAAGVLTLLGLPALRRKRRR